MKKYKYLLLLAVLTSCDSIKDVKAPIKYIANVAQSAILAINTAYPESKNLQINTINPDLLWYVKLENSGKNVEILTDFEGDILNTIELYGNSIPIPNVINEFINTSYKGAAIEAISIISINDVNQGYQATILDKNNQVKLTFNLNGQPIKSAYLIENYEINKIIYSNSAQIGNEFELPNEAKLWLKNTNLKKFDLKILIYKSGEYLVQLLERENTKGLNEKIEYLFSAKNIILLKYTYLADNLINFKQLAETNIENSVKGQMKDANFQYGVSSIQFGQENSTFLSYANNNGYKYLFKYPSKNSAPNITISRKIENNLVPGTIKDYVLGKNATLKTAKEYYKLQTNFDLKTLEIAGYQIEIEYLMNSNVIKKLVKFDNNFKVI